MADINEIRARLSLLIAAGGDSKQLRGALKTHGTAVTAIKSDSLRARLKDGIARADNHSKVQEQLSLAEAQNATWSEIADLPLVCIQGVYPKGPTAAIVGTRDADSYGITVAKLLARTLVEIGVTVISGAARGVDEAAHRATIDAGGKTVAVLGTGLLGETSVERVSLHKDISQNGAVVTEYLMKARGARWTFPERNRVIALLSDIILVVQAPKKSGALITAKHGKELGKPVFAVPGDVIHPLSVGTNALIQHGDARLLARPSDLMSIFNSPDLRHAKWPTLKRSELNVQIPVGAGLGKQSYCVLEELMSLGPLRFDQLVERLPELRNDLAEILIDLELKGKVVRGLGESYSVKEV